MPERAEGSLVPTGACDFDRPRNAASHDGRPSYDADMLVVALGADYDTAATPGFEDGGVEYYSVAGAERMRDVLSDFGSGKDPDRDPGHPFKCPPAPFEGALLCANEEEWSSDVADAYHRPIQVVARARPPRRRVVVYLESPIEVVDESARKPQEPCSCTPWIRRGEWTPCLTACKFPGTGS